MNLNLNLHLILCWMVRWCGGLVLTAWSKLGIKKARKSKVMVNYNLECRLGRWDY